VESSSPGIFRERRRLNAEAIISVCPKCAHVQRLPSLAQQLRWHQAVTEERPLLPALKFKFGIDQIQRPFTRCLVMLPLPSLHFLSGNLTENFSTLIGIEAGYASFKSVCLPDGE
jgi:hypothetical protein